MAAFTGFYIYLFIPSGAPQGRYQVYLVKATWIMIHNRISILLTITVVVQWLSCMTRNLLGNSKECER
ncbi:hypothetical protein EFE42_09570 [Methanohalophilus sp. RSK]|nr:hypothetical protein EFE42_09570 [Methanohalophilus sp. RSK]